MDLNDYGLDARLVFALRDNSDEHVINLVKQRSQGVFIYSENGTEVNFTLSEKMEYEVKVSSDNPVSLIIGIIPGSVDDGYHIIPCNIHGDNNLKHAQPGYFPNLTYSCGEYMTSSEIWEFRADRASHPVSMIHSSGYTYGISVEPYSLDENQRLIRNGVFSKLPATAGISVGYRNHPKTFTFKETFDDPTYDLATNISSSGRIYMQKGNRLESVSVILRDIYNNLRNCPFPSHSAGEYLDAFIHSYEKINWSDKWQAFTNMKCRVPDEPDLRPWRPLIATGWTGTGVMAYPLLCAQSLIDCEDSFTQILKEQFESVAQSINPSTGMFYDLTREINGSRFNGWWAGYMVSDCHCAYTNGQGAFYLMKAYLLLKEKGEIHGNWLQSSKSVVNAAISMQKEDGNYGYTYSTDKPGILDEDGFAGCWFAAAAALLYKETGEMKYLRSAEKALEFYHRSVSELNCWGTPMDTWKSIDQEGNLAFIKAAAELHKAADNKKFLRYLEDGACYEYLWRYAYKAKPEYRPLKGSDWNSCGGSVTSVSNPHIHPMGVNVTAELIYLYQKTGDVYHLNRAEDGICWGLATADLYPGTTGYGRLGVISERWCPSDGLVVERFSDTGERSSMWFTFNGWAGASVIEGLTEPYIQKIFSYDYEDKINNLFEEVSK